jgi:hypothetical protein
LLDSARRRSRQQGLVCTIGLDDIVVPPSCPLLDIPRVTNTGGRAAGPASPSLDRIDPAKGYVPGNVWVISYRANAIKRDAQPIELYRVAVGVLTKYKETA